MAPEIIMLIATALIGVPIIGYTSTKVLIWGTFGTLVLAAVFGLTPGSEFVASEVTTVMFPKLWDVLTIFPRAMLAAASENGARHGLVGSLVVYGIAILLLPLYLLGVFMGLTTWPELIPLRVLL